MAKTAGFNVKFYRYYSAPTKSVDFDGMREDIEVKNQEKIQIILKTVINFIPINQ